MKWPYNAHLTLKSDNRKTGSIPVSVTSNTTCPTDCAFKGNGCYAEGGPLGMHWREVSNGDRGMPWEMFCDAVSTLPEMQLWRHNAAGDLPGNGTLIDASAMEPLLAANFGKRGFTYTHYRPDNEHNARQIVMANIRGLTVNVSANNLHEADKLLKTGVGPVVAVLPYDQLENTRTPAGRTVTVCPAITREGVSCATCQLCARKDRTSVIGFPAHGQSFKKVTAIAVERPA